MTNRRIYFKPINELTTKELKQLFPEIVSMPENFIKKYGSYSIATFPTNILQKGSENPLEAHLLGYIYGKQTSIPENKLICLFGAPGCGKSHLIHLVANLKNKSIDDIKALITDTKVNDVEAFQIKEMVDSIVIIPKKTTRPKRKNEKQNNPEILEGISKEEVQKCDFNYEYSGNLYGVSKKDIDDALLDGSVLMIINDLETLRKLHMKYSSQLHPVYIYRATSQKEWKEAMQKSGRSPQEIQVRTPAYQKSINLYKQIDMTFPEAIINMPELDSSNTVIILLQLKQIIERQIYKSTERFK